MQKPGIPPIETPVELLSTRVTRFGRGPGRNDDNPLTPATSWVMDPFTPGITLIEIVVRSISSWLLKIKLKRQMEEGLGRTVDAGELTSIAAWMKVPTKDFPYPRDENPRN